MTDFVIKETGGAYTQAPVGTHRAICTQVIDLGTQERQWEGKTSFVRQVFFLFELSDELMDDGRPFTQGAFFTASLSEKSNLRAQLASWRGRDFTPDELAGFNIFNVLGASCLVSIITKGERNRIGSISALAKGMPKPKPVGPLLAFNTTQWDGEVFDQISEGIRKIIMRSEEGFAHANPKPAEKKQAGAQSAAPVADMDDDIPFSNPYKGRLSYVV